MGELLKFPTKGRILLDAPQPWMLYVAGTLSLMLECGLEGSKLRAAGNNGVSCSTRERCSPVLRRMFSRLHTLVLQRRRQGSSSEAAEQPDFPLVLEGSKFKAEGSTKFTVVLSHSTTFGMNVNYKMDSLGVLSVLWVQSLDKDTQLGLSMQTNMKDVEKSEELDIYFVEKRRLSSQS